MPYTEMDNITPAKLALISERARKDPKFQFTSLAHLLNEGFLKECYFSLGRDRASGIDGVSWKEYGERLDENISDLVARLKAKRYKPQPSQRVYIPKDEHSKRPLGLPALEDKIVQKGIGASLGYYGKCSSGTCPLTANPYRGAIYGAVMGALLVSLFSRVTKEAKESSNIIHINSEAEFKIRVLDAPGVCLVDMFSNRCPPCRVLAPTISSLADKYAGKIAMCKVDVDRVTAIAEKYGVTAIPTVLIISNGKEVNHLVGLQSETEYIALLEKLVDKNKD